MTKMATIEISGVSHKYGQTKALSSVTLRVRHGEVYGLIGADGAGKSTLFHLLATLLPLQEGTITLNDLDIQSDKKRIRTCIGYMPQGFSLYPDLTVLENLAFAADMVNLSPLVAKERIQQLLTFSRLSAARDRRAGRLSGGMKQKLALCCALVRKPDVLLLDEPTVGVDPVTRKDFWEMLASLREQGTTALVSTPYMDEAELCDQVALIHQGNLVDNGTPDALCKTLPGRLWRIQGKSNLHVPATLVPPSPLIALYPAGGDLHALAPESATVDALLTAVKRVCPGALDCAPARVRVEDVLFYRLQQQNRENRP